MPCADCERLIGEDQASRKKAWALFEIEQAANMLGYFSIARMARRGRIGKVACDNEDAARIVHAIDNPGKEVIIPS